MGKMSVKRQIVTRRTDRASLGEPALINELRDLRQPIAGDVPLAQVVNPMVREGELYTELPNDVAHCFACAHECKIKPGGRGICQVRYNLGGKLHVPWGYVAALQCDPTEKKPFNHIYPGSDTLTFGMLGCDLHCPYCQNWDISQAMRDANAGRSPARVTPQQLVESARRNSAKCIASSYNEPLITSEWARAVFQEAKSAGFTCMYISNGNATRRVLEYIRPYTDGYKIDLKTMNARSYQKLGGVLAHILDGVRMVHELGFWLEIVTLTVPGFNDSNEELRDAAQFIKSVSPNIPWHVTAFHKDYKMLDPDDTDADTLIRAAEIGYAEGLHFVYAGNLPGRVGPYENTLCPDCHETLIERAGYVVLDYQLTSEGACPKCRTKIPGIWPKSKDEVRLGTPADLFFRVPRPAR
jgi:pyruvate formate lyase activating enzyme